MAIGKKGGLLGGGLMGSSLLDGSGDDDDPRTGLVNLADVMLVFACGLMIALVGHYNVDLSAAPSLEDAQKVEGEMQQVDMGSSSTGSNYSEVGTVYQDNDTGELYVVKP